MNPTDIVEALLFAAGEPVSLKRLAGAAGLDERAVLEELQVLREEKARIGGVQVVEVAGGWQMVTKPAMSPFVRRLRDDKRPKLSRAAFETLAIVAYRQPATKGEVEELRGVDCSGSLQLLLEKKLLALSGRKEVPGRPWLYKTTPRFLEQFGLRDIKDLPALDEFESFNQETLDLFDKGELRPPSDGAEREARFEV